ncbi:heme biosynthesis protein HemY [Alphaproteobacteria bacterium]|nr:heme biosynthesis protein HemY [Alphaproteobacteria bacterium]
MNIFRTSVFLILTVAVVLGEVWLVDHPGDVTVYWRGYRIDTSVAIVLHVLAFLVAVFAIAYRLWSALRRAPQQIRLRGQLRRERRGYDALSQGLIAAASGDSAGALRNAKKAGALLNSPPIAKLLTAQAAELTGDKAIARENFQALADDPQTALLGIRGLMAQARNNGNSEEALRLANEAYRLRPSAEGLLGQRLELQIEGNCWVDAEATVQEAVKRKEMDAEEGAVLRAAMMFEQARLAMLSQENEGALLLLQAATKLHPQFIAGQAKLAEQLGAIKKVRRASRIIEKCWTATPHPSLAAVYRALEPELDAVAQVKRFETLFKCNIDHVESHLAVAEAALAAKLWGQARFHLEKVSESGITPRLCRLMATLEEAQFQDRDKAQNWLAQTAMAEPDMAWLCGSCGVESAFWGVRCSKCGVFNEIAWEKPLKVARISRDKNDDFFEDMRD